MFVTDSSPSAQSGPSRNTVSQRTGSGRYVWGGAGIVSGVRRIFEGAIALVGASIPGMLCRDAWATCGLLLTVGAVISSPPALAETPYLLADSNATPREIRPMMVLGSTMYAVDRDGDGALYLLKMGPSDVAFQKVVKVVDNAGKWSANLSSFNEWLLIELQHGYESSYFLSDGSTAAPRAIPIDKRAYVLSRLDKEILFRVTGSNSRLVGFDPQSFSTRSVSLDEDAQLREFVGGKFLFTVGPTDCGLSAFDPLSFTLEELLTSGVDKYSNPFAWLGSRALWETRDVSTGQKNIWITDGSRSGTVLVRAFPAQTNLRAIASERTSSRIMFASIDSAGAAALWGSDGSPSGTTVFYSLPEGEDVWNSEVYSQQVLVESGGGKRLWRTNGTTEGTVLLVDLSDLDRPGLKPAEREIADGYFEARSYQLVGNSMLFVVDAWVEKDGEADESWVEVWKTDGSPQGTAIVQSLPDDLWLRGAARLGQRVLFEFEAKAEASLWSFSETEPGVKLPIESAASILSVDDLGGERRLLQVTQAGSQSLYITDGTIGNTKRLRDFAEFEQIVPFGGEYLLAATEQGGPEELHLWRTNGTVEGTVPVLSAIDQKKIEQPSYFATVEGKLFLAGQGSVLWHVAEGFTVRPRGYHVMVGSQLTADGGIAPFASHKEKFLFSGSLDWPRKRGSFVGTYLPDSLTQFSSAIPSPSRSDWDRGSIGSFVTEVGDHLYFFEATGDKRLTQGFGTSFAGTFYRTDLTKAGTVSLGTFGLPGGDFPFSAVGKVGTRYLFEGTDSAGWGVFSTDGSASGMRKVDVSLSLMTTYPVINDVALLDSWGKSSREIWRTDGTPEGSEKTDLDKFNFDYFHGLNGVMYFLDGNYDEQGASIVELWQTDGSKAGSKLVKKLSCESLNGAVITEYQSTLLILCGDSSVELWSSDGTSEGTSRLKEWNMAYARRANAIDVTATHAFITVTDRNSNFVELWKSDGSANGTVLLKRWEYESVYGVRGRGVFIGSTLYFTLWNEQLGTYEIWKSDGTSDGTKRALDVPRGTFTWMDAELVSNGETVVFTADDGVAGGEPWAFTTKDLVDQCPDDLRKTKPGVCGCGKTEMDSDSDGVVDCKDRSNGGVPPTPTPTPTPSAQPTVGDQSGPKVAGMAVSPPIVQQQGKSVVVSMQAMQGVSYKITYTIQTPGASKKKKVPAKVITTSKPQTALGNFKVGATLGISYKIISGVQESLPSKVVRFKVKPPKKGTKKG